MKTVRQIKADKENKYKEQFVRDLKNDFKVVEHDGLLWLTHKGQAFASINPHASAEEVVALLNDARNTAIKFEGL